MPSSRFSPKRLGLPLALMWAVSLSDVHAQTLEEALTAAYLSNPTLKAQRASVRATDELVPQALSGWRPTATLQSSIQTSDIDSSAADGSLTGTSSALVLEQNLYRGGETTANTARAERLVRVERARLMATYRNIVNQEPVSLSPPPVLKQIPEDEAAAQGLAEGINPNILAAEYNLAAAEIALEGSQREAEVGQRTTLDVLDQENDLFQAGVDLVQAQRDEIVASYRVKAAVGQLTAPEFSLPVDVYDSDVHYQAVRNRLFRLGQ